MDQSLQDLRFGVRILWKAPGLTSTAAVLIALVIGGNTTIYSMVHALLTRPAPGVTAKNLYYVGIRGVASEPFHPIADLFEISRQTASLRTLVAYGPERLTLTTDEGSYASFGSYVTTNYFDGLGVRLTKGRSFMEAENQLDSSGLVAVISYRMWQERFHSSEDTLGRFVVLNGHPATVIGIAPPRFQGADLGFVEDVWVPMISYLRVEGRQSALNERSRPAFAVMILGQLASGTSLTSAQAEFTTISSRLQSAYPEINRDRVLHLVPYAGTTNGGIAQTGPRFLAIFSIVTAITLFVVCANVANLLLARAIVRQRETAVRQSLGASKIRIVRMLTAEGLTISSAGWIAACLFAFWTSKIVVWLVPANMVGPQGFRPNHLNVDFNPDWRVLAYAMILAVVATLAFTIAPAIRACRQEVMPYLKAGDQSVTQGRSRLSSALVVMQLAFSVLLLASAGLAYRSMSVAGSLDLGFNKNNLLLVTVNPTLTVSNREENLELIERARERFSAIHGVTAVSYVRMPLPFTWGREPIAGSNPQQLIIARSNYIGPDYLRALGIRPLAGREFTPEDRARSTRFVVINQNLADALWSKEPAVGQTVVLARQRQPMEVIGVAPNALFSGSDTDAQSNYILFAEHQDMARQTGKVALLESGETTFYIRYSGPLDAVAPSVASALKEVDGRIPIVYSRTMETQIESLTITNRVITIMLTMFGGISTLIAAVGQYAVVAFDMRRRRREFGLRVA